MDEERVRVVDPRYRRRSVADDARRLRYLAAEFMLDPVRLAMVRYQVSCALYSDYNPWPSTRRQTGALLWVRVGATEVGA